MAAPLAVFCCLLFLVSLYCCAGLPRRLHRSKRELDDDSIITALKMYESQMARLESKIAQQEETIKAQRRRIDDIRYYLKAKGDDYDKDELEGLILSSTESVKRPLKLVSLDNLVLAVNDHEKRQQDVHKALKKDNELMGDIHRRVLDNRLLCRDTHTDWKERAGGDIRELARHFVKCNQNELLQRLALKRDGGGFNSKVRYEYRCCHLSIKDKWQSPDGM